MKKEKKKDEEERGDKKRGPRGASHGAITIQLPLTVSPFEPQWRVYIRRRLCRHNAMEREEEIRTTTSENREREREREREAEKFFLL